MRLNAQSSVIPKFLHLQGGTGLQGSPTIYEATTANDLRLGLLGAGD
jgi:hypothetical protein